MRNWIKLITEGSEDKKTTVKDKTADVHFDIDDGSSKGDLAHQSKTTGVASRPGKTADAKTTRASVRGTINAASAAHLSSLHRAGLTDEIDDAEAARRAGMDGSTETIGATEAVPDIETLPAVISTAMFDPNRNAESERSAIKMDWHQVKNLPGYMQQGIRAMGRMVFAPFTDTPIDDIQVLSTLSNPEDHVKAVMSWLLKNGMRDDDAELKFDEIMPGYSADIKIITTLGFTFMCVKDHMGHYVYSWPGGRENRLDGGMNFPQLESFSMNSSEVETVEETFDAPEREPVKDEDKLPDYDLSYGMTDDELDAEIEKLYDKRR